MRILCVCTAGRTRSVWMRDYINSEIDGAEAWARGISSRIEFGHGRRFGVMTPGPGYLFDLILTVSNVHSAFARGYLMAMHGRQATEVVTVPDMRYYKTDPERARDSIRRIVERRMNKCVE